MALFGKYEVLLAPMAGVTDAPFRQLCLEAGADLAFTEMVSSKGLAYANDKTRRLLDVAPNETQVAVQIFGHEPEVMAEQAAWVEDTLGEKLAFIDINMGCPARKIVTKGDGSALMRTPDLAAAIVEAVRSRICGRLTCKIRRGWSEQTGETAPAFARLLESAGADAVCVHGRYSTQMYRGDSCRDAIARVKAAVKIPVIGNGDIRSGEDAAGMIADTGCDAVMIARAAQGNPWVFADAKAVLSGRPVPPAPGAQERIHTALRHAELLSAANGDDIRSFRKHAMWYVAGLPGASIARGRFNYCTTYSDFAHVFKEVAAHAA